MRRKRVPLLFVASVASLVLVAAVYAGGWAIVTVRDLPEYAVAGKPVRLAFMVRQHGIEPLGGLEPQIAAKSGTHTVRASASPTKNGGEYTATLALPRPGHWTVQISGTLSDSTLPELTVIAPGSPAPQPLSPTALGERLFVAKGCIGCHLNREVRAKELGSIGPDLTGKRFPETYLKSLLADPKAAFATLGPYRYSTTIDESGVKVTTASERFWEMPDLGFDEVRDSGPDGIHQSRTAPVTTSARPSRCEA